MNVKDVRKHIKQFGFRLTVRTVKNGRKGKVMTASIKDDEGNRKPLFFKDESQRAKWRPILEYLNSLDEVYADDGMPIVGLTGMSVKPTDVRIAS